MLHQEWALRCRTLCRRFRRHSDAASLGEYALLLGVISVALIVVISQFKDSIGNSITRATTTLSSAETGTSETPGGTTPGETPGGGQGNSGQGNGGQGNGGQGNNGQNGRGNGRNP